MSKHTAGPWIYYTHPQPNGCPIVGTENGLMVCQLAHSIDTNAVEALANAKLISAAPCLLEALIKRVEDGESAAFEDWLTSSKPSGDAENVHRQWLRSSNYSDFRLEWYQELEAIAKETGGEE